MHSSWFHILTSVLACSAMSGFLGLLTIGSLGNGHGAEEGLTYAFWGLLLGGLFGGVVGFFASEYFAKLG
mgnify:CR=1 FL=1